MIPLESLQQILPDAIAWVEQQSLFIQKNGTPLTETGIRLAIAVGVSEPEKVRTMQAIDIPCPTLEILRNAAIQTGLLSQNVQGITFEHFIFIKTGHMTPRLLSHELRHVHQYEKFGSISSFLAEYLNQIISVGYDKSPLEIDARTHEQV